LWQPGCIQGYVQDRWQDLGYLEGLAAAHAHFREIKGTGVLGIFPFGQESATLKVPAVMLANSMSSSKQVQACSLHGLFVV